MSFWAYMLHCKDGLFYVGHTDDLDARIGQHQSGLIPGFTRKYAPVKLVWSQDFPSRIEALEAERRIKGWSRAKKLALIRGDWERISLLAKGKSGPSTSSGRTVGRVGPSNQEADS
jgi:predicted GIY-YIG superfamily endonuclease